MMNTVGLSKGQETVDSGSQKIGKLMREDPEEVTKTIISSSWPMNDFASWHFKRAFTESVKV
jgi:hypothetical protein